MSSFRHRRKPPPPQPAIPEGQRDALTQRVEKAMEAVLGGELSFRRALGLLRGEATPEVEAFFQQASAWVDSRSLKAVDRVEERLPGFRKLELRGQVLLMRLWVMKRWLLGEELEATPGSGA